MDVQTESGSSLRHEKQGQWIAVTRLARYFGASEQFWMGLQSDYGLEEARKQLGRKFDAIEPVAARRSRYTIRDPFRGIPGGQYHACSI